RIADEVTRARKVVPNRPVQLFVAGFTDTVGSNADNRKLSLDRARAIGAWFRDRGLPLPIAYAGFGEEVLRVKTPDETDNAANRRADYVVGFAPPVVARGVHATWMKLQ
ncbi:MAG: OmpA family protein, partial [Polyangia bacterium]